MTAEEAETLFVLYGTDEDAVMRAYNSMSRSGKILFRRRCGQQVKGMTIMKARYVSALLRSANPMTRWATYQWFADALSVEDP